MIVVTHMEYLQLSALKFNDEGFAEMELCACEWVAMVTKNMLYGLDSWIYILGLLGE